jgi:hypothetical protein
MLAISPREMERASERGGGLVPSGFANIGAEERRRAAESARLRIDLFKMKLLGRKNAPSSA